MQATRKRKPWAYVARDYSLCKLARNVTGPQRRLLEQERSRNALALAAEIANRGGRWRALVAVGRSLPFSWKVTPVVVRRESVGASVPRDRKEVGVANQYRKHAKTSPSFVP